MKDTRSGVTWDGFTLTLAVIGTLVGFLLTIVLDRVGAWPRIPWANFVFAAISGATVVHLRHPGHGLLTFLLFPPVLFAVVFIAVVVFGLGGRIDVP